MRIVHSVRSSTLKYHPGTRHLFSRAVHHSFPTLIQQSLQSDSGGRSRTRTGTHIAAISNDIGVELPALPRSLESVSEPTRSTSTGLWHETSRCLTKLAGCLAHSALFGGKCL